MIMSHYITTDHLVDAATKAITEELFREFCKALQSFCNAYVEMKHRKNESRTYFLDKKRERLNLRMQRDDEKERERRR